MATGILGLGSGQAATLNQDLIDKLKAADRKARVEPFETSITNLTKEKETFDQVETKVAELLSTIKPFDLFVTGGATAFDQKSATTSGDSVTFDAADVSALSKGSMTVNVSQLAQRDVYQSNILTNTYPYTSTSTETLSIKVGSGEAKSFEMKNYTSYDALAKDINNQTGINASFEKVGTDTYRLVIKSEESGIDNKLTISGTADTFFGFNTSQEVPTTEVDEDNNPIMKTIYPNHIQESQNMKATVDGVAYSVSSNTLTVDGLKIVANKEGISSINISEDKTNISTQMQDFVTKYNELVAMVEIATDSDSEISNKSGLRDIVSQVKSKLFGSYGTNNDKSLFNYGFELAKDGSLSLDSTKFNKTIENSDGLKELKDLFIGSAENKGLGTTLKETLDEMSFSSGALTLFNNSLTSRETTLNKEKTKAEEALDAKYKQLASQFSAYSSIITQFESSFSGLKMLIAEATSSN